MSLPTIEPLPEENTTLPPARRRRQRRMIVPAGSGDHADFLRELARRTVPSFDFFLFSLLAGLCLGAALLLDAPALIVLAALLAPFLAPAIGVSLGTITGAGRFILQSLASLSIGSLIVFLCGALAGWAVNLLPQHVYTQAALHSLFTWPDFLVLVLGAGLTTYLIVRSPNQKPLVTSVAIAYELYLPIGAAGFGMASGVPGLWPQALALFFTHLVWVVLVSALVLVFLGLRPLNATGYLLGGVYALAGVAALFAVYSPLSGGWFLPGLPTPASVRSGSAIQRITPTPSPSTSPTIPQPTETITLRPTQTRTLIPTRTSTVTITPVPTPVWAKIASSEGNGAIVREEPNFNAKVVQSLLNGTLVEVLPDVSSAGGTAWVHIRTVNGKEGWIVRTLLRTATPAPGW